ncbi:MAG: protein kinase domain-containing protein [Planctomycetaceae bacterium]
MTEQDTARTIIFDLVRLEKLAAELERRFRIDASASAEDVLEDVGPEDQMLYLPQLNKLLEGLAQRKAEGTLEPMDPAQTHAVDVGDELRRSLMATALVEGSDTKGSAPSSHKISAGHGSGKTSTAESEAPDRIDQFRILRELGTGAFGVVYLAEDESLQRKVAIKVPKVSDPRRSESYIHEARKAAAIDCKGIVPIYHVGTKENGVPFVVQKLIDGPSLRVLLNRYGSLPPAHAVTLMRDIAVALASAHRLGIYHRDLKPDNVLLDGNGVPWIADFGLAISESEQAQRKGEIAGTLMYMSPEQIQGRADWLDGRSDIWALGIMLYELLLGKPPFSGKNRQSLMEQICHRQPRPLQQSSPTLAPLNEIFQKCCAKSPSDRYASVEELSDSLTLLIDAGLPTQPIDGSVIQLEQPISQYPSDGSHGNRSRSASGSVGTQSTGRVGSTLAGGGSGTEQDSGHRASSHAPATAQSAVAQSVAAPSEPAPASRTSGHSARMVMVGVGIAAILAIGAQQWSSRPSKTVVSTAAAATESAAGADLPTRSTAAEMAVESDAAEVTDVAGTDTANMDADTAGLEKPANALSLSQANGSAALPWVVAADGSGSHQTIAAAIADSAEGAGGMFINIAPGTYVEALKITRPMTLVGQGEPSDCVIFNTEGSPLEIDCGLGTVRLANLAIRGDGRPSKKEFNAVELTSGKARLENCRIKTSTWNCVKVHAGTSLVATDCQFEESSYFAISGRSHIGMEISDCQFLESGIQVVDGAATIQRCAFKGNEGVYVERSGDVPTLISDSHFVNSFDYGVVATTAGSVEVRESTFEGCKRGVQVNAGKAELSRCSMNKCTIGLEVVGGSAVAKDQTRITGGMFGCSMIGGSLRLVDVGLNEFSDSGVIALEHDNVELVNTTIQQCGTRGLTIKAGALNINGGVIKDCADAGIYIGETFTKGEITGTSFENNLGAAIIQDSGDLACRDVSFAGSTNALLVYNPERPVNVSFEAVSAKQIDDVVADLYGSVLLSVRESQLDEVPEAKRFRALGGAEVKLYQAAK